MSLAKLNAFITDITALKTGSKIYHPSINIDNRFGFETSVKGLVTHLRATYLAPAAMTLTEAVAHCNVPTDERIVKYMPAIERLVECWGTGVAYPNAAVSSAPRNKAMWKFALALRGWPLALQASLPAWNDLDAHAATPIQFGNGLGPGYLRRVINPPNPPLDITARSLLLRAGLAPPLPSMSDNGYLQWLGLEQRHLDRVAGRTVLDVACGGALFLSEMAVAYGCATDGLDFHAAHIGAAVAEGQRRYAKSMMYLKMLNDRNNTASIDIPNWSGPVIDRLVSNLPAILTHYANNLPQAGDILATANQFQLTANGIRAGGWDYCTCMFLLCYFNNADQTTAVLNMCSVTARTVFLYSGDGLVLNPQLGYDQNQVRTAYPNCDIKVISPQQHHIRLQ
jgi:hypothetical protein